MSLKPITEKNRLKEFQELFKAHPSMYLKEALLNIILPLPWLHCISRGGFLRDLLVLQIIYTEKEKNYDPCFT